jgi:hypothetical protein
MVVEMAFGGRDGGEISDQPPSEDIAGQTLRRMDTRFPHVRAKKFSRNGLISIGGRDAAYWDTLALFGVGEFGSLALRL